MELFREWSDRQSNVFREERHCHTRNKRSLLGGASQGSSVLSRNWLKTCLAQFFAGCSAVLILNFYAALRYGGRFCSNRQSNALVDCRVSNASTICCFWNPNHQNEQYHPVPLSPVFFLVCNSTTPSRRVGTSGV